MNITAQELKEKINNGDTIIVDFYAKWCGPCKAMAPSFEQLAKLKNVEGSPVYLYKYDVESDRDFTVECGITSVPTIKAYKAGEPIFSKTGIMMSYELNKLIDEITQ